MLDDLKKLLGGAGDGDVTALAGEIQKMSSQGTFDPYALFAGQARFHSVFLAPFTPTLIEARTRFLADGTGPLAGVVEVFRKQGAGPDEALASARAMFTAAQGMCVVIAQHDQGLDTVPQLFFGHLEDEWIAHAVKLCGDAFPDKAALEAGLREIRRRAEAKAGFPALHAGGEADTRAYWSTLALDLVDGLDSGIGMAAPERLRDLAAWIAAATAALEGAGFPPAAEALPAVLRCQAIAGDVAPALARLGARAADLEEEDLVTLLHQLVDTAIARGEPASAADWFDRSLAAVTAHHPASYDLLFARFKALAAAQVEPPRLQAAADALVKANRKNARHDLGREPIWRVTLAEPGELIDTAQAAEAIGRSPAFVAKRLEQGTIPFHRQGDQLRIPRRALDAWKAVVDAHRLLD